MKWEGNRESDNVEDARGGGGGGGGLPPRRRARHRPGHDRRRAGGRLDLRHQPADGAGPAQRRRRRRRGQVQQAPAAQAAGRRHAGALRLGGAGRHRRRLARAVPADGRHLPRAQAGAVPRRRAHRLRHRPGGDGAVLLPGRPEGLHRPRLLRDHAHAPRRAGRLRAGLRDRARGRPPRAEPDGHHRQGRRACAAASARRSRTR